MNFFASQAKARRNTLQLVFLFILAVCCLIILTNLMLMLAMGFFKNSQITDFQSFIEHMDWWKFGMVGLVVWVVILAGSISKIIALSGGGKVVAEALGGTLVLRSSSDARQRRLLNVVEEMAIASGTPVPPVYIMQQERGINAFAAGYSSRDAVISVTQGLLDHLNREQLQGVIAHEFSHIFNGDMRLNIRLAGMLNGILIIGTIGYEMLTLPFRGSTSRSFSRSRGSGSGDARVTFFLISLGLGLMIIGYTGTFFGNMIKAAVSRQREYLADASAVQYTRNPQGLAGALKRIGGLDSGSGMHSAAALEFSHTFFAQGVSSLLTSLFATHPPLVKRIRRIDPYWNGHFFTKDRVDPESALNDQQAVSSFTGNNPQPKPDSKVSQGLNPAIMAAGELTQQSIEQARELLSEFSKNIRQTAAEPFGARAIIYSLLLDKDYPVRVKQLDHLQRHADREVYQLVQKIMVEMDTLDLRLRLPLVDITIPVLKQLSNQQYQSFRDNVTALMNADGKIDLMEWSLKKILLNHLDQNFHNLPRLSIHTARLNKFKQELAATLSLLAIASHRSEAMAMSAFKEASAHLKLGEIDFIPQKKTKVSSIDNALERLNQLSLLDKMTLLEACILCIEYDNETTSREIEILRAFSSAIDCPIPVVVSTQ
jgi:Zn-dependent protease with chaperone function